LVDHQPDPTLDEIREALASRSAPARVGAQRRFHKSGLADFTNLSY
jgi:hypothetical protein